jgi:iron complex outermembrane receptor protein
MKSNLTLRRGAISTSIALASALISTTAFAQDAEEEVADSSDIVVTGTLIRGVAPSGASPISVDAKKIQETGATTVAQVLQTIPQLASFGSLQTLSSSTPELSVNRPNLRSLPGFNTSGGSSTLVLLDGHRIVGMGSNTTTPDPDFIPAGVLQRIEIVPDGGSAVYGSDAVAGVMNFITISRFDGVKVDASYGFADNYYRYDGNITAGKDWGSGSLFASYNYSKGDDLLGKDRDYIRQFPTAGNGRIEIQCAPGNVQAGGVYYAQPGVTANTFNQCDSSDNSSLYPAYKRHSLFAGLTQQLSDAVKIDIRAFYTNRDTLVEKGPFRFTTPTITAAQATGFGQTGYAALGGQTVAGQIGPNNADQLDIGLETWGVTPTITADLGGGFQLRVLGSHGESLATRTNGTFDNTALANLITSGAFNPYNPSSASPAAYGLLTNVIDYGRTRQYMDNARIVLDGGLFELPAGQVKIAIGGEYTHEQFIAQNGATVRGFQNGGFTGNGVNTVTARVPIYDLSRTIKSAFGELVIPVLGGGSYPELTLSAAGRYDDYSDVGSTFNPRFGATFKPAEWLSIRGAWGKSFNAPSLADDARGASTDVFFLPSVATGSFRPPADLVANGTFPAYPVGFFNGGILAIRGNSPGIKPQTSKNWTVGFDMEPPFIPGLSLGATYYNIDFKNYIGLPNFGNADDLYRNYGNVIDNSFTQADLNAIIVQDTDGIVAPFGSTCPFGGFFGCATPTGTYAIFDARKQNVGSVKLSGLDFRMNYETETSFGSVFFGVNGTYDLKRQEKKGPTSPYVSLLGKDNNRLRMRSTIGAEFGSLLAQVTWTHRGGYDFSTPQGFIGTLAGQAFTGQSSVSSFNTFDLFFKYDVPGDSGIAKDLSFTLNVENLLDQDPPEYRGGQTGSSAGIINGNTIGRFIKFGVSKKF